MSEDIHKIKAVALSYDEESDNAPKVEAVGRGLVAREIIKRAELHGIPVFQDEKLVNALDRLELGQYIPHQLYLAVAEIICFAMEISRQED